MKTQHVMIPVLVTVLAVAASGCTLLEAGEDASLIRALGANSTGVMPISRAISVGEQSSGGRVIAAELEQEDGELVYEVELYDPARGEIVEIELDAVTGELRNDD